MDKVIQNELKLVKLPTEAYKALVVAKDEVRQVRTDHAEILIVGGYALAWIL